MLLEQPIITVLRLFLLEDVRQSHQLLERWSFLPIQQSVRNQFLHKVSVLEERLQVH